MALHLAMIVFSFAPLFLVWLTWPVARDFPRLWVWAFVPVYLACSFTISGYQQERRLQEQWAKVEAELRQSKNVFGKAREKPEPCGAPIIDLHMAMVMVELERQGWKQEPRSDPKKLVEHALHIAIESCGGSVGTYIPLDLRKYVPANIKLSVSRGGHIASLRRSEFDRDH